MTSKAAITAVREALLTLPEKLAPGDSVEVLRHGKTVLKILRPLPQDEGNAFDVLDECLAALAPSGRRPPKDLASRHKHYLYGKKNAPGD